MPPSRSLRIRKVIEVSHKKGDTLSHPNLAVHSLVRPFGNIARVPGLDLIIPEGMSSPKEYTTPNT
ncbi:unnamed protein product [Acidithrix sp. C25]|nr:unnamed protein product [Acidithrix sp. C25]